LTTERSLIAYDLWRRASDKVDYYVLSISAALTAYLGQHIAITRLAFDPLTLELASLLLFATSVLLGLERIKAMVTALGAESGYLAAFEQGGQLRTLLQTPASSTHLIDEVSGEAFPITDAGKKLEAHDHRAAALKAEQEKWKRRSKLAYVWRDRCLMLGITLYAVAKLWTAILAT
jgi:hypothetical protein